MAHDARHQTSYGYGGGDADYDASGGHGMFELQTGMEMLGMPSSRQFLPKSEGGSGFVINPDPWPSQLQQNQALSLSLHHEAALDLQQNLHQMSLADHARFFNAYHLKNSVYLAPAQELLNEFCSLGAAAAGVRPWQQKPRVQEGDPSSSTPTWNQPAALLSMDVFSLQKRKDKLLSMLQEVDRRYRRYCEQMRAVVASFEAVAGPGTATVYTMLASKTMSRHFRCLRDGVMEQIVATKKAMGEKDPVVPGTTKGETPRLKVLDQCLRQQKSLQHGGMMESHPWRPQRGLPERSVSILRAWLFEHFLHPYPSDVDKHILARQTGLSRSQVSNWFINARVRLWKPMVEEMYLEETKEQDKKSALQAGATAECETTSNDNNGRPNHQLSSPLQPTNRSPNPSATHLQLQDHKPRLHIDSDSLTSIMNGKQPHLVPREDQNFGFVDLDFASYNVECNNGGGNQHFGQGVSLTLGLQQHSGGGMSLSFSPASQQSVFFSRDQMEDCQPVHHQFSALDGDHGQHVPYRNLMGAQMLHDLAG